MNHMQSLKFEHKLYASVKEKMEEMQQHNMSWIEVNLVTTMYLKFTFVSVAETYQERSWGCKISNF